MSLALLQGYSSADDEEQEEEPRYQNSSEDDDDDVSANPPPISRHKPLFDPPNPSAPSSSLPSAFDAFSEISGPPEFLNHSVQESVNDAEVHHRGRRNRRDKKDLPAGAVMEAKAQLVGIHERVRSDVVSNLPQTSSVQSNSSSNTTQGGKRVVSASNPNMEDAAELLRVCLQCGVPKTFSNAKGIVCPLCGDRPTDATNEPVKNKGSTIKDKEKSKRMKGQSSHATWKSETEMQLRQQFD